MTNQTCKAAVLTKKHTIEVMDVQMPGMRPRRQ